ncbi:hypothetical protein E2C01_034141 [Portunus trituberculatus]|uniref:Uncharacterized protein n=1 Tax=Portunus trituberculatus TaxID=210409 RepID=A0A5B7F5M8_PORTR|nr:hypothetical protein [Portunus trituberculatus]
MSKFSPMITAHNDTVHTTVYTTHRLTKHHQHHTSFIRVAASSGVACLCWKAKSPPPRQGYLRHLQFRRGVPRLVSSIVYVCNVLRAVKMAENVCPAVHNERVTPPTVQELCTAPHASQRAHTARRTVHNERSAQSIKRPTCYPIRATCHTVPSPEGVHRAASCHESIQRAETSQGTACRPEGTHLSARFT